ncbi:MAG: type II toxin-antitoxin system RelB/DinJ family antitoxin [Oscillospiraceae bacterium]|nr:type II toxin-antitoxin system RelB/DinJ family antitoxin [Oscillospiraceae bacterium]
MPVSTGANANINIRVDRDIKNKAQDVFAALGLDMTTAVNIFLRQAIRKNGIPFELIAEQAEVKRTPPRLGYMKGQIKELDGHDWFEPLDDFKEYM